MDSRPADTGSVAYLRQLEHVDDELEPAARTMIGACLLGALEHFGRRDYAAAEVDCRNDIRMEHLVRVFRRPDHGLHGCGFEYAVHAALAEDSTVPRHIRDCVLTVLSAQVGSLFAELGVPVDGWRPLRSVMFGVERVRHPDYVSHVVEDLGRGALLWPSAVDGPQLLGPLLPLARIPPWKAGRRLPHHPDTPAAVGSLWQTDLFLGGALVRRTQQVRELLLASGAAHADPTAWVAASVKYRYNAARGGPGLHMGIDTSWDGKSRTRVVDARVRTRKGLRNVTLPLDGPFVMLFNDAWRILRMQMVRGLRPTVHPTYGPNAWHRHVGWELSRRRAERVLDVALEMLSAGQPGLVAVDSPIAAVGDGTEGQSIVAALPLPSVA